MEIKLTLDDARARAALAEAITRADDLSPLMANIREELIITTKERFQTQTDPEGNEWKPLSENYRLRKKLNKDKILSLYGHLRDTIQGNADASSVEIGSALVYAATHQFGAIKGQLGFGHYETKDGTFDIPWGDIPGRPFVGLSDEDRGIIEEEVASFFDLT